jgi:hypothetical protein
MCLRTRRALVRWCVVSLLLAPAGPLHAQAVAPDAAVAEGVRQAEEGEYDAAILTLDAATRRLAGDHTRAPELARAYVYLGIAYLAKGHETAARARFREALAQVRDLELEPEKFAPRVIELFEKAREEAKATAPPEPKGGGHKGLLIGAGVVAAGGAGVAIAAGGGGGDGGGVGTPLCPSTISTQTSFQGLLGPSGASAQLDVGPFRPGNCVARLTWNDGRTEVRMFVNDAATGNTVGPTNLETTTSSSASWSCQQAVCYRVDLFLQPPLLPVNYNLQLTVP